MAREMFGEDARAAAAADDGAIRKLLQQVDPPRHPPAIVSALLQFDARDKSFFEQRDKLDVIAARMTTPTRTVTVTRDDEHNAFELARRGPLAGVSAPLRDRRRLHHVRRVPTLLAAYREIQDIKFPGRRSDATAPRG